MALLVFSSRWQQTFQDAANPLEIRHYPTTEDRVWQMDPFHNWYGLGTRAWAAIHLSVMGTSCTR